MSLFPNAYLSKKQTMLAFLSFALAYFLSNMVRAIMATLSSELSSEFGLSEGDLGLLAGAYFFGFAIMQLPLGAWLDKWGAKKVEIAFVSLACVGFLGFSLAEGFTQLLFFRALIGVGVSACLMAPMKAYRTWFDSATQLKASSWMLMTGALGMIASTLPVQWALPILGWRGIFILMLGLTVLSVLALYIFIPSEAPASAATPTATGTTAGKEAPHPAQGGYAQVMRHPYFQSLAPMAFLFNGGMIAMQTLWAGPWMQKMAGLSPAESRADLFMLNVVMLFTFLFWGLGMEKLNKAGWGADRLMRTILPFSILCLALLAYQPSLGTGWIWALYMVLASPAALAQPNLAMQFGPAVAGRALTLFNLLIFAGSFSIQWGFGKAIDFLRSTGQDQTQAYQGAMLLFMLGATVAYVWYLWRGKIAA